MAPLLLALLLAGEAGPPPDPYEPLIFQMMLHEVVVRALEPVVPRTPLLAGPGAVLVQPPVTGIAGVPGAVTTRVGVAPAGVPGVAEVKAPTVAEPAVGPVTTRVGVAPAGVPGTVEVKAPVTGQVGVPGAAATRVGVAPGGVPGAVEVKAPVTGQAGVPRVAALRAPDKMAVAVGAVGTDAALIAALAAGDRSPERQAQVAALPDAYLFELLDHLPLLPWSEPAGDALAEALLSRGVAVIDSRQWSYTATMHLAGALARQRDERCVTLYEELLGRREGQAQGSVLELIHLARYYESVRRYEQASETFLRHEQFSRFTNENANCCVEAARCLVQAGYAQRAWVLYERVADYGYGWATGLAAADRAGFLQRAGRPAEALALLRQPVTGALSERVAIVLAMQEALCYLALGQAAEARESYRRALAMMERLQVPPDWEHLGEHLAWIRPAILGKE